LGVGILLLGRRKKVRFPGTRARSMGGEVCESALTFLRFPHGFWEMWSGVSDEKPIIYSEEGSSRDYDKAVYWMMKLIRETRLTKDCQVYDMHG
jgi:hypothetical protein